MDDRRDYDFDPRDDRRFDPRDDRRFDPRDDRRGSFDPRDDRRPDDRWANYRPPGRRFFEEDERLSDPGHPGRPVPHWGRRDEPVP